MSRSAACRPVPCSPLQPEGNYVMIKGSPTDPNADFLRGGQQEMLQDAIDAGDITIVGEAYTDGWLPANAQRNMEQILTAEPTTTSTPWWPPMTAPPAALSRR
jgi:ABC-type xylose transport system substrate-binding protein